MGPAVRFEKVVGNDRRGRRLDAAAFSSKNRIRHAHGLTDRSDGAINGVQEGIVGSQNIRAVTRQDICDGLGRNERGSRKKKKRKKKENRSNERLLLWMPTPQRVDDNIS